MLVTWIGTWLTVRTRIALMSAVCCFSLVAVSQPPSSRLTGTWIAIEDLSDGARIETPIVLVQAGSRLTGKVEVAWADLALLDGQVNGDRFSFAIPMGDKQWRYEGVYENGELRITLHDPNAPPRSLRAVRAPAENPAGAPQRIPPPASHAVASNGLARTPPMGWNSWNHFQGHIDDRTVRETADAMVGSGMRDAGYLYVTIDDTWEGGRDDHGNLIPNRKFPDMRALADYVHARGLKLGIYSSPGPTTCAGYAGSYGHEEQDARTFAAWGVDYLKYDWCSAFRIYKDAEMRAVYQKMGDALLASGRPMVYSFSQGGKDDVWTWGRLAGGNLWRTTDDIRDSYSRIAEIGFSQDGFGRYAAPGGWNDPDMLEIGNGGLNAEESLTHMSLWALLSAPLIAGNDLRNMDAATRSMLTNAEVIAIDQDPRGIEGRRVLTDGQIEVWIKPLADGSSAVGIFNRGNAATPADVRWQQLGLEPKRLNDVWKHTEHSADPSGYRAIVPAHGVVLLRVH